MRLALIVAMAENRVIGINNNLPWHLPNDLKYFKAITMGKPVIMGRKTHESIGRPLPGRSNIVISGDPGNEYDGCSAVASLTEAIELAENIALIDGASEAVVIGGAQIYAQTFAFAQRLYLTLVQAEVPGDTLFPEIDLAQWQVVSDEMHASDSRHAFAYRFVEYQRRGSLPTLATPAR